MPGVMTFLAIALGAGQPVDQLDFADAGRRPWVSEGLGLGRPISELIRAGDCRMMMIGDSISNRNSDSQDESGQSSMFWAIVRRWQPERWVGIATPSNSQGPNIQLARIQNSRATVRTRTLVNDGDESNIFSYGYQRFSSAPTLDVLFDVEDFPSGWVIIRNRLMDGDAWADEPWFSGPLAADFVYLRTPETVGVLHARSSREGGESVTTPAIEPAGPLGIASIPAPDLGDGGGLPEFSLISGQGYDELARPDHLIWLTTWVRRTDATGFSLNCAAVGGAGVADFLSDGRFATDERLGEYLAATGHPNLFHIHLGTNDTRFPTEWRDQIVELIDRLDRVSAQNGIEPSFLLVGQYGTTRRISQVRAKMISRYFDQIARSGTPRVSEDRIAMCSLAEILGEPVSADWLVDGIHPNRAGAHNLADLFWAQIVRCRADVTGSDDPDEPSYGVPDGQIDGSDFFYYLELYAERRDDADLSGDQPGVPDGILDGRDFFFYLDLFATGCE